MLKQDDVQISHFSINDPFHNIKSRQITISLTGSVGDKFKRDIFLQHSRVGRCVSCVHQNALGLAQVDAHLLLRRFEFVAKHECL